MTNEFAGASTVAYWNQVDLYVGGSEHATGHSALLQVLDKSAV